MIKVFSFGGGVQSTAALVLAAQKKIDYSTFLFCNVGADSENPATLEYVEKYARPYAAAHKIEFVELQKVLRDGTTDTIYQRLTRPGSRSIGIPVRMSNGSPGNRTCTVDFKVEVVDRWLRRQGAKDQGAIVGLGISLDEFHRMRTGVDPEKPWKRLEYPLIDMRLDRAACQAIIERAGLPVPPKSSCYFCPYHRLSVWQQMRQDQPDLFAKAVALERLLNERREMLGRDQVWFTSRLKPLDQATSGLHQDSLFDEMDNCESGFCWT